MPSKIQSPIIVALDVATLQKARSLVDMLDPTLCRVKIGKELFTAVGPAVVEHCVVQGFDVFLDLKFHDIPATVASACKSAADLGVWMLTLHACGGEAMMQGAIEKIQLAKHQPLLVAVTVLTSMDESQWNKMGSKFNISEAVALYAAMAKDVGMDGVVSSAHEAQSIKQTCGANFIRVCPGIRWQSSNHDDQSRVMTPIQAIEAGASYLVIGRPITQARDPKEALLQCIEQLRV
ncbi:MAG: orotidine-5'-phosphate decarboxylase [Pseudomonadota bacterium]